MNRHFEAKGNEERDDPAIARAAAEWTIRAQQGLSAADEQRMEQWLRDPKHAAVFGEMHETSTLLDRLRDPALAGEDAMTAGILPLTRRRDEPAKSGPARWMRPMVFAAAAAAAIVVVGTIGRHWERPAANRPEAAFATSAETAVGGWRKLDLPDGSVVLLNTASAVDVRYSEQERRVRLLRGEAFFSVAKDPQRPFFVAAESVAVRAVGTAFNVRHRVGAIEVLVTEGKVRVDSLAGMPISATKDGLGQSPLVDGAGTMAESSLVRAGEKAMVAFRSTEGRMKPELVVGAADAAQLDGTLAWRERRLKFAATPLGDVVAEFNRYNSHQLVIADPALAAEPFGGAFAPNGYEALVELLQESFGVVADRRASQTILQKGR